jgi:hypothetical protein
MFDMHLGMSEELGKPGDSFMGNKYIPNIRETVVDRENDPLLSRF